MNVNTLTIEETAAALKLNPEIVRRKLRAGKLPGLKIGRVWRVPEADLQAFLRGEWITPTTRTWQGK